MLPEPHSIKERFDPKYVSVAIPHMISDLERLGALRISLRAAIVGGANVLRTNSAFDIGKRNVKKAVEMLESYRIPIDILEVGGNRGRNVVFLISTGEIIVSYTADTFWRRC